MAVDTPQLRSCSQVGLAPPPADRVPHLTLQAIDWRALARRAAVPAALAAVAAVAVITGAGPVRALGDAFSRALQADPRWVISAAVLEMLSFGGYIALLWLVGSRATRRMDARASAQVALSGAGVTRLLPTAGVGGAALTLWALRRAGLGTRQATRTLLTFLVVLYAVFLGAIVVSGGALALGIADARGPLMLCAVPAAGAALGIALPLATAAIRPEALPGRLADGAGVLGGAVRDAIAMLRAPDVRMLGALAWWAFDAGVLLAMLHAFGAPPALAVVALAYFVGQVGNTIPVPGAVSGGMVGVLVAFGVQADLALVAVLAYRSVAIWLPAAVGLSVLRPMHRTLNTWKAEDAEPRRLRACPDAPDRREEAVDALLSAA